MKNVLKLLKVKVNKRNFVVILGAIAVIYTAFVTIQSINLSKLKSDLEKKNKELLIEIDSLKKQLTALQNEDQRKKNNDLQTEISNIQNTYNKASQIYEKLTDLRALKADTKKLDDLFAQSLAILSNRDYQQSSSYLDQLSANIDTEKQKLLAAAAPANAPSSNSPPSSGSFSGQQVTTPVGSFFVDIIAADISSTKVIVDTASDSTCTNNCPVLPLSTYVSRNGAYAGVNGSYFCPSTYPSCAGKTNSFDLLLMNKNKTYFNSDNNVYSSNPGVIFGGSYIRFVSAVSQWGRDTGIDSMISNFPLLVEGGNIRFTGDSDPKQSSRGGRSFVANKGNTVYIGTVFNASVAESAQVMKALGMENALNLDDGGSVALWYGGYKAGPGRDLPNAILFVKK
ncbi:MAG: phosphodiester glycosidase family protein [Candidatus Woesebacteria bacterium]|nr:MAG: phosphodiester glycosidase family protein [Candidatus Woesebacteria bacterium]